MLEFDWGSVEKLNKYRNNHVWWSLGNATSKIYLVESWKLLESAKSSNLATIIMWTNKTHGFRIEGGSFQQKILGFSSGVVIQRNTTQKSEVFLSYVAANSIQSTETDTYTHGIFKTNYENKINNINDGCEREKQLLLLCHWHWCHSKSLTISLFLAGHRFCPLWRFHLRRIAENLLQQGTNHYRWPKFVPMKVWSEFQVSTCNLNGMEWTKAYCWW